MYFRLGQMVGIAFLQGGAGCHVLSESVYDYLAGMNVADLKLKVEEVAEPEVKTFLSQVILSKVT